MTRRQKENFIKKISNFVLRKGNPVIAYPISLINDFLIQKSIFNKNG